MTIDEVLRSMQAAIAILTEQRKITPEMMHVPMDAPLRK